MSGVTYKAGNHKVHTRFKLSPQRQANYQRLDEAKLKLTKSDPTETFGVGKAHLFDYLLHSHMLFYNCHNF